MGKLLTKKVLALITIISLVMAIGAVAYADSAMKQVTAYQNQAMKVTVNGQEIDSSTSEGTMYPLVYAGHSYVSAKALAEALGASVKWNESTGTVEVTSGEGNSVGKPTKDNTVKPASTPQPTSAPTPTPVATPVATQTTVSTDGGTKTNPVSFGTPFTWVSDSSQASDVTHPSMKAEYTVTLTKVEKVSDQQVESLGFKKPELSSLREMVLVTVKIQTKKATFTAGTASETKSYYLSMYIPGIWGTWSSEDNYIIGGYSDSFKGGMNDVAYNAAGGNNMVAPGDSKSFEFTGQILATRYKGDTSTLVFSRNGDGLAYEDRQVYFKMQ